MSAIPGAITRKQAAARIRTPPEDVRLKRETMDQLIAFRDAAGAGCYRRLRCKGLTTDDIYQMVGAGIVPIEKWKLLRKQLDRIMRQEKRDAT